MVNYFSAQKEVNPYDYANEVDHYQSNTVVSK